MTDDTYDCIFNFIKLRTSVQWKRLGAGSRSRSGREEPRVKPEFFCYVRPADENYNGGKEHQPGDLVSEIKIVQTNYCMFCKHAVRFQSYNNGSQYCRLLRLIFGSATYHFLSVFLFCDAHNSCYKNNCFKRVTRKFVDNFSRMSHNLTLQIKTRKM